MSIRHSITKNLKFLRKKYSTKLFKEIWTLSASINFIPSQILRLSYMYASKKKLNQKCVNIKNYVRLVHNRFLTPLIFIGLYFRARFLLRFLSFFISFDTPPPRTPNSMYVYWPPWNIFRQCQWKHSWCVYILYIFFGSPWVVIMGVNYIFICVYVYNM